MLLALKTLSFSYTETARFLAAPKLASFSRTKTVHFLHVRSDHSASTKTGCRLQYAVRAALLEYGPGTHCQYSYVPDYNTLRANNIFTLENYIFLIL
jgi:hypothetical protein